MSINYVTPRILANVPDSREHTNTTTICYRNNGTLIQNYEVYVPTRSVNYISAPFVFHDGKYTFKDKQFELNDGKLVIGSNCITLPTRTHLSTVERLILGLGVPFSLTNVNSNIDITDISMRSILETCTMLALKDLGYIPNNLNLNKQRKYGEVIFGIYLKIVTGSSRIGANNSNIRWLNEEDTLQLKSKLFTTSSYQAGVKSMKYTPTELAEQIIQKAFDFLLSIDFISNDGISLEILDFSVPVAMLKQIRLRDSMLLMNDCIGYNCDFVIRPILTDGQDSRVYSVFTSISSATRKRLGYINYDIGAALQTICLQLVQDDSLYPLHKELVNDKTSFRNKVIAESGKDLQWVKKELTSADNREKMPKKYDSIPILKAYFDEALLIRREIIESAEPLILNRAISYASDKYKKIWDDIKKEFIFEVDGKKEASIFFFIWTQWERQIRQSMMSCFDIPIACHQVHDAVYSKQEIEVEVLEQKVLNDTGFKIKISRD